jgi:hypothetical protein
MNHNTPLPLFSLRRPSGLPDETWRSMDSNMKNFYLGQHVIHETAWVSIKESLRRVMAYNLLNMTSSTRKVF